MPLAMGQVGRRTQGPRRGRTTLLGRAGACELSGVPYECRTLRAAWSTPCSSELGSCEAQLVDGPTNPDGEATTPRKPRSATRSSFRHPQGETRDNRSEAVRAEACRSQMRRRDAAGQPSQGVEFPSFDAEQSHEFLFRSHAGNPTARPHWLPPISDAMGSGVSAPGVREPAGGVSVVCEAPLAAVRVKTMRRVAARRGTNWQRSNRRQLQRLRRCQPKRCWWTARRRIQRRGNRESLRPPSSSD